MMPTRRGNVRKQSGQSVKQVVIFLDFHQYVQSQHFLTKCPLLPCCYCEISLIIWIFKMRPRNGSIVYPVGSFCWLLYLNLFIDNFGKQWQFPSRNVLLSASSVFPVWIEITLTSFYLNVFRGRMSLQTMYHSIAQQSGESFEFCFTDWQGQL